jgi:hypothetical protein
MQLNVAPSSIQMQSIIEPELVRRHLHEQFLVKVNRLFYKSYSHLSHSYANQIVLRYILNKNITKTSDDDPVFITSKSKIAEKQIIEDFKYSNIDMNPQIFIDMLEKYLKESSDTIANIKFSNDHKVIIKNNYLYYDNERKLYDISHLSLVSPHHAYALNLRYTYLHLEAHGLARPFEEDGYKRDQCAEAFASSFNHYFDEYCSAFPDLETVFGSRGSFFDVNEWYHDIVFVNPPFDVNLMSTVIYKVMHDSERMKNKFIFTIPNWSDMEAIKDLIKFKNTTNVKLFKKQELCFINHMTGNRVYPCDILEITLQLKQ